MYRWDPEQALELVEAEGVNAVAGVPMVVRQLLERARRQGRALPSLGGIASGGAPVPPDLIDTIGSQFISAWRPATAMVSPRPRRR